jgi:glyceraldehyde-3-phosphate dehydrogenase/erythrose-4-phosphate dehydrogenase
MTVSVGINGFGRVGRAYLRHLLAEETDLEVVVDLAVLLECDVTVDEVNSAFEAAGASGPLAGRLRYTTQPVVSSDVIGDSASLAASRRWRYLRHSRKLPPAPCGLARSSGL